MKKKCLFLDRDGVIIEDKNYLSDPKEVIIRNEVPEFLLWAKKHFDLTIILSNQSGIGRGYFNEDQLINVNEHINSLLEKFHLHIDHFFHCPHSPNDQCDCRKPLTGLLEQALKLYPDISISHSIMIGDKESDCLNDKNLQSFLIKGSYPISKRYSSITFNSLKDIKIYLQSMDTNKERVP